VKINDNNLEAFLFEFRFKNLIVDSKELRNKIFASESPALLYFTDSNNFEVFELLNKFSIKFEVINFIQFKFFFTANYLTIIGHNGNISSESSKDSQL
jgi:hypothetical protein